MAKYASILETIGNTPVVKGRQTRTGGRGRTAGSSPGSSRTGRTPTCTPARPREILADFAGERLDYWVTGFGTGGTLKGVTRVLAKERPETKIVLAEPADAPLASSGIAQERNTDGAPAARHPAWKPHPIQGWSPDFIPKLTGDAVDAGHIDRVITVPSLLHPRRLL